MSNGLVGLQTLIHNLRPILLRKEQSMYASVRRYEGIKPDSVDEIVRQVEESFVPSISAGSGFVAYFLLDAGNGAIATVSVFEDQAGAEKSNRAAAEF